MNGSGQPEHVLFGEICEEVQSTTSPGGSFRSASKILPPSFLLLPTSFPSGSSWIGVPIPPSPSPSRDLGALASITELLTECQSIWKCSQQVLPQRGLRVAQLRSQPEPLMIAHTQIMADNLGPRYDRLPAARTGSCHNRSDSRTRTSCGGWNVRLRRCVHDQPHHECSAVVSC